MKLCMCRWQSKEREKERGVGGRKGGRGGREKREKEKRTESIGERKRL